MSAVTDVVTVGETMALLTASDLTVSSGARYELSFGGAESNVAIGLARLGHSVTWMSSLGQDAFGDMIEREVSAEGVTVVASRDDSRPTGLMVKNHSVGDTRNVRYYRSGSAASVMGPDGLDAELVGRARILHLTGITPALSTTTRELSVAAATLAKEKGVLVSFDLNYRPALWSEALASAVMRELVALSDIVFGSPDELSLIVDRRASHEQLARGVGEFGPRWIVVKDGERGAGMVVEGDWWEQPAYPVDVVDTVGAGDGFVAGFLSEVLEGSSPEVQLQTAVVTGALCCTHHGDWQGFPTRDRILQFREAATK